MRLENYCGYLKLLLQIVVGCVFAASANAINWEGSLRFSPTLYYTDNVCLDDDNKQGDFSAVAIATPAGSMSMESSRICIIRWSTSILHTFQ